LHGLKISDILLREPGDFKSCVTFCILDEGVIYVASSDSFLSIFNEFFLIKNNIFKLIAINWLNLDEIKSLITKLNAFVW